MAVEKMLRTALFYDGGRDRPAEVEETGQGGGQYLNVPEPLK